MAKATGKVSAAAQGAATGKQEIGQHGDSRPPADAPKLDGVSERAPTELGPALVIFGRDEHGKAHAAWFGNADAELAEGAAAMVGFQALRVTSEATRVKALEAAPGRIFGSGKALAPFCRTPLLEALEAFPEAFRPATPAAKQPDPTEASLPQWQPLQVGAIVLATLGDDQGWYEARVTEDRGESLYVLAWVGWPDDPPIVRRASALALIPTQMQAPSAAAN